MSTQGFITVPVSDGSKDMSDTIQQIINENPNRTIFFPDGIFRLDKPICTPADPRKSVSLKLSNFATVKACDGWEHTEALIRLGGQDAANDIRTPGSNYALEGGIIDGNGVANGVSIDGGRETAIRNLSIKRTLIGIHIKYGANGGSSDADINNVNIVGNKSHRSVGVLVEGFDNTFTEMRIADVFIGVHLKSGGNFLRAIHPLYTCDYTDYQNSCAFLNEKGRNWYTCCYNDQFGVGFCTVTDRSCTFDSCYNFWYSPKGDTHTAFRAVGKFNSILTNFEADFHFAETKNIVLEERTPGGHGKIKDLLTHAAYLNDDTYKSRLVGDLLEL